MWKDVTTVLMAVLLWACGMPLLRVANTKICLFVMLSSLDVVMLLLKLMALYVYHNMSTKPC